MSLALVKPVCVVPASHFVNDLKNGERVVAQCSDLRAVVMLACMCTFALVIVVQSCFFKVPAGGADAAKEKSVVPCIWALVPLAFGLGYFAVAGLMERANFAATQLSYDTSGLSKSEFVQMAAMDRRTMQTTGASIASTGVTGTFALLNRIAPLN